MGAEFVRGRVCKGPSLSGAEFVRCRDVPESNNLLHEEKEQASELVVSLFVSQGDTASKLKNELETEKKTVHKFVAQNVERQREIVRLKTELAKLINLHTQEVNMRMTLEDKVKRKHRVSSSEKENGDPQINGKVPIIVGT